MKFSENRFVLAVKPIDNPDVEWSLLRQVYGGNPQMTNDRNQAMTGNDNLSRYEKLFPNFQTSLIPVEYNIDMDGVVELLFKVLPDGISEDEFAHLMSDNLRDTQPVEEVKGYVIAYRKQGNCKFYRFQGVRSGWTGTLETASILHSPEKASELVEAQTDKIAGTVAAIPVTALINTETGQRVKVEVELEESMKGFTKDLIESSSKAIVPNTEKRFVIGVKDKSNLIEPAMYLQPRKGLDLIEQDRLLEAKLFVEVPIIQRWWITMRLKKAFPAETHTASIYKTTVTLNHEGTPIKTKAGLFHQKLY